MAWRFWPVWMSAEAAQRIEDKIDELRRELREMRAKLEHADKVLRDLETPTPPRKDQKK